MAVKCTNENMSMSEKTKLDCVNKSDMETILLSIFQSSYDGIYVADNNGVGMMVNSAYSRITGVKSQELLGKNMMTVVKEGLVSESVTMKVLEEKTAQTIIQTVRGKELLVTGNPVFDHHGNITYVVTNVRDISDLNYMKTELIHSKRLTEQYIYEIEELKKRELIHMHLDGVICQSQEIMKVFHLARKVAKVHSTVLILGESGVGKEVIVNYLHQESDRANAPLIKVNCGAIPKHLLESELFGYEKGAFTGADSQGKPGLFEQADGGTIFLDEIGDMPIDLQVKLLRVLQEFEIMRVGGRKSFKIDVRVISATNMNLEEMVDKNDFRRDLYYRLNIVPIKVPPLRERIADIVPLAFYFLNKTNKKNKLNKRFHHEIIHFFEEYRWPGNIRELENLIERLVVTTDNEEIGMHDLPQSMLQGRARKKTETRKLKEIIANVERKLIKEQMEKSKTTRVAAKELGISQSALVKKMQKLGL
ncbi:sigma 54-interacting transcriptional regulator [Neobacillus sp. MM2021_6]|uniref:sigma-54 interaction domain-containing protein n=1 Tax=Bacillaceae TaxID=186817 RepID=UPI00140810ED|nr:MULTISPECIES: sigma 54-interacting transcriptional regulator [Bacillaceae]MBO0962307.1 sigma 54-interacting transcriptional regulator [Neobacillus sp. MM2021_6]NHC20788.1 sigma 54-interacting transcriptional regulator [Bacillus sp. MM2020_4]